MTSIKDLQTRLGVDADGVVGPATIRAINAALDKALGAPTVPAKGKTISDFIGGFIDAHEGGLSMDPQDNGNWTGGKQGIGSLVGSKFGVTPGAVAQYRGVWPTTITKADIANLTRDEAVAIGVKNYYEAPGFDRLPMSRVTLSIVDMGWGTGPAQAIKLLQRMVGVAADGKLGPATAAAYTAWLGKFGEEQGARQWGEVRNAFYKAINQPRFLKGWMNRTASFLPGTKWWSEWAGFGK